MRVHHLNCGTMDAQGIQLVTHVLAVETDQSLVLVDTGFGTADLADPTGRLGPLRLLLNPACSPPKPRSPRSGRSDTPLTMSNTSC